MNTTQPRSFPSKKYLRNLLLYWLFLLLIFTTYRYVLMTDGIFISKPFSISVFRIAFLSNITYLLLAVIGSHIIVEWLLPKFYSQNQYVLFSTIVSILLIISPLVAYIAVIIVVDPYIYKDKQKFTIAHYLATVMKFAFCLTPLIFYKTSKHLRAKEQTQERIERDKLETELKLKEAELKLLKGQIHPHFLFNTLNNLYSLSLQRSDKTSGVIIKISDLLNYIIYECNAERVSLEKETEFISTYIDLEKLRYDETLMINTSFNGNFTGKYIAPMILHTFVENSFKHGASKDTGNPWIDIILTLNGNILNFTVINSRIPDDKYGLTNFGIGIENAKKRLQLIYPNKHLLEIVTTRNTFNVSLEIQL